MIARRLLIASFALGCALVSSAQPAFVGPAPARTILPTPELQRAAYLARVDEILAWRSSQAKPGELFPEMTMIATKLALHQDAELCSRSVIQLMKTPASGPFWMFPTVNVAFLGRDQLSLEARQAIRKAWSREMQMRGDTENHWAMYYTSLYLMAELYPNEPGSSWYSGKSSADNLAEAKEYLIDWMNLATTVGQGEFNPTHYIGEYAIPMLYLATWAKDPAMRLRGKMTLDWIFADLAENTLNGVLHGANARTDDVSVIERGKALASFFSWVLFGNVPPIISYGGWGLYFATVAKNYELPEVIYRIAVDRPSDYVQRDFKRTRRRWRNSDVLMAPIYKTNYTRRDYAVGSYQGGLADPIQTHVWDVTWDVRDPRGVHNTMFSMHPVSSSYDLQTYFSELPDQMAKEVTKEGKASYDSPDKFLGGSRFEQVFQDLDTVIALYDIPVGTRFPHINGFFSKDLVQLTVDPSGWIFAQGGSCYLAYRPLAAYQLRPVARIKSSMTGERASLGDQQLFSPHLKNGTIVQAAAVSEFKDFAAFQAAIRALPLSFQLVTKPTVTFQTLRGKVVTCTFGAAPIVNGQPFDYTTWKLFEGPYLNAEKGSGRLTITHGALERILDFKTLSITDRVKP